MCERENERERECVIERESVRERESERDESPETELIRREEVLPFRIRSDRRRT